METGRQLPSPDQVDAWASATGAAPEQLAEVDALAEAAATEAVAWRRRGGRLAELQHDAADLEASAGLVRVWHPLLLPGLVQVPGYARAVYLARARIEGQGAGEVAEAVAARLNKQAVLHAEGKRFEFLASEAGLRWRFTPPDVMLAQLDRLDVVSRLPNVWLGILPVGMVEAVWRWGGFTCFTERADGAEDLVQVEELTTGLNVRNPADVARHLQAFGQLAALAVTGEQARALLARIGEELRTAR